MNIVTFKSLIAKNCVFQVRIPQLNSESHPVSALQQKLQVGLQENSQHILIFGVLRYHRQCNLVVILCKVL